MVKHVHIWVPKHHIKSPQPVFSDEAFLVIGSIPHSLYSLHIPEEQLPVWNDYVDRFVGKRRAGYPFATHPAAIIR